jgi:hypothetical protein
MGISKLTTGILRFKIYIWQTYIYSGYKLSKTDFCNQKPLF